MVSATEAQYGHFSLHTTLWVRNSVGQEFCKDSEVHSLPSTASAGLEGPLLRFLLCSSPLYMVSHLQGFLSAARWFGGHCTSLHEGFQRQDVGAPELAQCHSCLIGQSGHGACQIQGVRATDARSQRRRARGMGCCYTVFGEYRMPQWIR